MSVRSAMISRFCVKPTSKRWFSKNNPSDHETWSIQYHVRIHPCRLSIHLAFTYILRWSLKRRVKQTWTGSAVSTNESAWCVMVTGPQSRVWSGPNNMYAIGTFFPSPTACQPEWFAEFLCTDASGPGKSGITSGIFFHFPLFYS